MFSENKSRIISHNFASQINWAFIKGCLDIIFTVEPYEDRFLCVRF